MKTVMLPVESQEFPAELGDIASDRVGRLLARLQDRMTRRQRAWGGHLTVLDDPTVSVLSLVERQAAAFRKLLREMPIVIEDDDLIVGNTAIDGTVVRPEFPEYATADEIAEARAAGTTISPGLGHKTPDYDDLINTGLGGIINRIDARLADLDECLGGEDDTYQRSLFRAMRTSCLGVIDLAHRHADLADRLASSADGARRREFQDIATICRRVPEHPATTFHEALQSFWFVHFSLFSGHTNVSCGRLDGYVYPPLQHQLADGSISLARAQELLDSLWLRFNDRGQLVRDNFYCEDVSEGVEPDAGSEDLEDWSRRINSGAEPSQWQAGHRFRRAFATDAADAINHFGQNILLSGIRPDGTDGTNELTYLALNSLAKFEFTSPVVTVRLHRDSPPLLVRRVAEVLKRGGGMPYINNDDVIVSAYERLGVVTADARDYANSNCWETMIAGSSDQELIRGMNFLLCLELALNQGVARVSGRREGPDTGDPLQFDTFEALLNAWKVQLDDLLRQGIDYIAQGVERGDLEHSSHGRYCFSPLLSCLTRDCIENGQDAIRGGARYTIWHVMGEAVANAADALAAIKKMVFEDRDMSLDELLAVLQSDWDGYDLLRQRFITRFPKWGNDRDYVDSIARTLMEWFGERSAHHAAGHPSIIFPTSVGTFSWYAMIGKEVSATPDGRQSGDPIAANFSPVVGRDLEGPTAALNSYLKMPLADLAAGAPLDLRFASGSLQGEPGTDRLAAFIRTFVEMGGNMLTLTVTDVETLKRAMEDPENHRGLRVRMGGWSAYFVMLSREQQLLHIQKAEHGLS